MTDEEALAFYDELVEHYGDKLVNFEHHPRQFQHQVTCYNYYKEQNERASSQPTE